MTISASPPPRALQKLAGALPAAQRRAAEASRDRLLLDHNRWSRGDQPTGILVRLRAAIADERSVRLSYRDRSGATTERVLEPLGLVAKAGVWYLVGNEPGKGYRTFRAQRITARSMNSAANLRGRPISTWKRLEFVRRVDREPSGRRVSGDRARPPRRRSASLMSDWESTILAEDAERLTVRIIAFANREVAYPAQTGAWVRRSRSSSRST